MFRNFTVVMLLTLLTVIANALCVKAPRATLRSGPGANFKKTWEVGKYMPFQEIGKKFGWYRVKDLDDEIHWIHSSLVSTDLQCVVVKNYYTNLRTGPGNDFPRAKLKIVDKYWPFKRLGIEDGWLEVQDDFGKHYFISLSQVWRPVSYSYMKF